MLTDQFELDPERRLWKPNRRSFFFGLGAALIAPMLPSLPMDVVLVSDGPGVSMSLVNAWLSSSDQYPMRLDVLIGAALLTDRYTIRV